MQIRKISYEISPETSYEFSPETSYEFSGEVSLEAADESYPSLICVDPNRARCTLFPLGADPENLTAVETLTVI